MKVDIYNSGTRPEFRLIIRAGQPVAPLVDDLITGVFTMVPLVLLAADVELDLAVPSRRSKSIGSAIKGWRGAVARISDFDDSAMPAAVPIHVECRND